MGDKGHYFLGLAYEKAGRNQEAIEAYETFLTYADSGMPELEDAKKKLAKLKNEAKDRH